MVDIDRESDIERLRQVARLLVAENERLHERLLDFTRRLAAAEGKERTQLELEITCLQEQLQAQSRRLFGLSSSEKRKVTPPPATEGDEAPDAPERQRRGHGPRPQLPLPVVELVHTLDAPDQMCTACGGELKPFAGQFEVSDEIDVVERSFRIVRHKRQKYTCRCGGCVETALGPPKLIAGGRYSIDFAVEVAVGKYADHLPLTRQARIFGRAGLEVGSQTLWDQIFALAGHLRPTYDALFAQVLASPVIGADETTWKLMDPRGGSSRWWVWALSSPEAAVYRILSSRSAEAARTVLAGFRGITVVDGYSAYKSLARAALNPEILDDPSTPQIELAACWAHARRRFVEAEPNYPQAKLVLDWIGDLYEVEAAARSLGAEQRLALRGESSRPITAEIHAWLLAEKALPTSALGRAIHYSLELWPLLTSFLDNAAIPLDNNATERALRGVAVGRKNHYGSRSLRGTQVAALFYTLIESAKLQGAEPQAYLAEAARRAIQNPGTVTLPRDFVAEPPPAPP